MELINIKWQSYIYGDSKFENLYTDLKNLTKNFINAKFIDFKNEWEDIFQDLIIKLFEIKNSIDSGSQEPIENFKGFWCKMIQNHINNMITKFKTEQNGLQKYQYNIENDLKHKENKMEETEIFQKFTNIMASVKNQTHVKIFIEFVKGISIPELAENFNLSTYNTYKIVERMRMKCIELWKKDIRNEVSVIINRARKESKIVFGNKERYAIETLIKELMEYLETQCVVKNI